MNVVVRRENTKLVIKYDSGSDFSNGNVDGSVSDQSFFDAGHAISALQSKPAKAIMRRETFNLSSF